MPGGECTQMFNATENHPILLLAIFLTGIACGLFFYFESKFVKSVVKKRSKILAFILDFVTAFSVGFCYLVIIKNLAFGIFQIIPMLVYFFCFFASCKICQMVEKVYRKKHPKKQKKSQPDNVIKNQSDSIYKA